MTARAPAAAAQTPGHPWGYLFTDRNQCFTNANESNGTDTGETTRIRYQAQAGAGGIRLVYGGFWSNNTNPIDHDARNNLTIEAAVETSDGPVQAFFGGSATKVIQPGGMAISDPVGGEVKAGDYFWVRSYVSVPPGGKWPCGPQLVSAWGEGSNHGAPGGGPGSDGANLVTGTGLTNLPHNFYIGWGPMAVLAMRTTATKFVIGVGDSIMYGQNTDKTVTPDGIYLGLGLRGHGIPYMNIGRAGERFDIFNPLGGHQRRGVFLALGTDALCNYGTNDLNGGFSLATIQANAITCWRMQSEKYNLRVVQTTIIPRTTSTDSFATAANQTPFAAETTRVPLNEWYRDGAPLNSSTYAAMAAGTTSSSAIRAGASGHPLQDIFDVAAPIEVNASNVLTRNGGRTISDGTANKYTDGTHPTLSAGALMVTAIDPARFV